MLIERLKNKWQIKSNFQLAVIFVVFAINGTLSSRIVDFALNFFGFFKIKLGFLLYYLLFFGIVTIIYPFLIIVIGAIFGQFDFFFNFSKKMLHRIGLGFVFDAKKNPD